MPSPRIVADETAYVVAKVVVKFLEVPKLVVPSEIMNVRSIVVLDEDPIHSRLSRLALHNRRLCTDSGIHFAESLATKS